MKTKLHLNFTSRFCTLASMFRQLHPGGQGSGMMRQNIIKTFKFNRAW